MQYSDYQDMIPSTHRTSSDPERTRTKFDEFLELCLKQGIEIANLLLSYRSEYDLRYATGNRLDVLGAIVGVSRNLEYVISGTRGVLADVDYRQLINARAAFSNWDGTNGGLVELIATAYTGDYNLTFRDGQDMSMEYSIDGDISQEMQELIVNNLIVSHPAGVETTCVATNGVIYSQVDMGAGLIGGDETMTVVST